ncbi:MAG: hypothetical protein P4L22_00055 [Candidatus Babeliales bacterium]|nr:hypothetical protein [Candidatus Babeliales bacterium]
MKIIIAISCLISLNLFCMEPQTSLESFFENPINEFNSLKNDDDQFYLALYYLNKILITYPDYNEKTELNSNIVIQYLESNPKVLSYAKKHIIKIIDEKAELDNDTSPNISIYKLIFKNIRNKKITQKLPNPSLLDIDRHKKLN